MEIPVKLYENLPNFMKIGLFTKKLPAGGREKHIRGRENEAIHNSSWQKIVMALCADSLK